MCVRAKRFCEVTLRGVEKPPAYIEETRGGGGRGDEGMGRGTGGRSRSRWSAVRYTPPQTYGAHCVPLGAHTPGRGARRFYRRRRDTRRDTPAFMDPTPCFFSVKRCARGNLETVESQFSARRERARVYIFDNERYMLTSRGNRDKIDLHK